MIDNLRDYLADVTARLGVGLESCCWGGEAPAWAYVALEWCLAGQDVALLWDSRTGWAVATEPEIGRDLDVVARLDGDVRPAPAVVADFVAAMQAELRPLSAA
ncbi:MAG: DUF6292 family protein [Kibdelosporangium sp.]